MISMNNQPGFIPVISMFPSPIFPQFIPTFIAPMIPYNLLPPLQNNNYPPTPTQNNQNNDENYQMPPGLSEQNFVYPSYGPYYISQQNNNNNTCVEGFNSQINPYNYGNIDNQDSEFASILNSVYTSVWDEEKSPKKEILAEISVYQGENIEPEDWERLLLNLQKQEGNNLDCETAIFQKLFENKKQESRFVDYCENDNNSQIKFNDFNLMKQRLNLMDSYKVEINEEGTLKWEEVNLADKEMINQNTTVQVQHEFGVIQPPIGQVKIQIQESDDEIGNIRELLSDNEEKLSEENNENEKEHCLQNLMGKDLNDQKGVDILETILQLQKQNIGPFFIDYQLPENNHNHTVKESLTNSVEAENQPKKNKKKRKNKNRKNTKKTTSTPVIENPELDTTPPLKLQNTPSIETNKTSTTLDNNNNEESEVTRAKRILAEIEDAINSLENPKPRKNGQFGMRNSKEFKDNEDDFFKSGSERIETNHSASTDFGEQSSTESGKNEQKLSKAQKKKLSKKKKQHMQNINDYIESASAVHKIDSNYIAMLSSVLAEDPFALVKLKEVVLAQNANENMMELGFTEEEIQEIEEVNLELEKTMKRRMINESDDSSEHNNSYQNDEIPEPNRKIMPLPEFLGEDLYRLHGDRIDILDEEPNISEADLTAISYLEELMKNRANFLSDFGISGFGPFEEEK